MKWRFTEPLKDQDMVAMTKIDFNTLSYDEGLALVKEAKEAALIKRADGLADKGKELWTQVQQFLEDNPGLLRNLGIGAGVGGGLGLASGLMGDKKSRRPIRRGIIGALLGALGGGAVHGGMNLWDIYNKQQGVEKVNKLLTPALRGGADREQLLAQADEINTRLNLNLSDTDIAGAVPDNISGGYFDRLNDNLTATALDPTTAARRGIAGAAVGAVVGSPMHRRWDVERAAGEAVLGQGPINARIKELSDANPKVGRLVKALTSLEKQIRNAPAMATDPTKQPALDAFKANAPARIQSYLDRIGALDAEAKQLQQLRSDATTISDFIDQRKGKPHFIAAKKWQKPWRGSGWGLRPQLPLTTATVTTHAGINDPITNVYERVSSKIPNKSRYRGRGAIGGAALGILLPDAIRAAKGIFVSPKVDSSSFETALKTMANK
jgi:hypothetical protein